MSCFCKVPLATTSALLASMQFRFTPPQIPLSLRLALAFGIAMDPNRLDVQLSAAFQNIRIPNVTIGGSLTSIALSLQVAGGTFAIDDIPKLKAQMGQAAQSINRNVWPTLRMLANLQLMPLVRLSLIARLMLDLRLRGIDPISYVTNPPPPVPPSRFQLRLTPPQITMGKLALGFPPLFKLAETLKVPVFDQNAAAMMQNRLQLLARLTPPTIQIPYPVLLKIAFALQALATIREAFGPDAMTPAGLNRIAVSLRPYMRLALPLPLPALKLQEQIALLPPMEDVKIATQFLNAPNYAAFSFTPPRLAIAPFLDVVMALNLSLNMLIKLPILDQCGACNALADALG